MSLLQVKGWLKAQHIQVHDEWIEACLDWLKSEHQGKVLNDTNLKSMVYEQWLDSDLSEIAPPLLPVGINKETKTELKGKYALQMNYVEDVSESAYAQLQKVKGKENANVLVTATPAPQSQYNAKSSRMLLLYLTDGHQSLQAMEYKPIRCLTTNLPPGTKVTLEGSITCRLGVLMLSDENIKVLGGEVDTLVETYSQVQVLSKALSDEGRTKIPEHFRNRVTTKITNDPEKCQIVPNQWKGNVQAVKRTVGTTPDDDFLMDEDDFNDDMLQEMKEIEMLERQHHQQQEAEEWPDDVDDDLLQSIPDDIILPDVDISANKPSRIDSMDTKPMTTGNQMFVPRSMATTTRSFPTWSSTSNNAIKSDPGQPTRNSTNFSTSSHQNVMNKQTVNPQSAVTSGMGQSRPLPDRGEECYSKSDDSKKESFEEVIMISDDEEDLNKCDKSKHTEYISLQESFQLPQGTFKIQGNFTTLITGLSYDSSGWKLAATVTDDGGQTTLDVDLADKVLSKLIGFTVLEMMMMKKEMKSNKKEVAQRIKSGLAECQDALKKMNCGMTIRKENSNDHPCIVDVDYMKQ